MECSHLANAVKISPQLINKLKSEKASHWNCAGEKMVIAANYWSRE